MGGGGGTLNAYPSGAGGGGLPINVLYGEALPERGSFFQASAIWKGRDFARWSTWKSGEYYDLEGPQKDFKAVDEVAKIGLVLCFLHII